MKLPTLAVAVFTATAFVGGTAVAQATMQPVPNPPESAKMMHHGMMHHQMTHHQRMMHHRMMKHHHMMHHHMKKMDDKAMAPATPK